MYARTECTTNKAQSYFSKQCCKLNLNPLSLSIWSGAKYTSDRLFISSLKNSMFFRIQYFFSRNGSKHLRDIQAPFWNYWFSYKRNTAPKKIRPKLCICNVSLTITRNGNKQKTNKQTNKRTITLRWNTKLRSAELKRNRKKQEHLRSFFFLIKSNSDKYMWQETFNFSKFKP